MTTKQLKFSHVYDKMPEWDPNKIKEAILMAVFKVEKKDLSCHFLEYDTKYGKAEEWKYYELPDGSLLVLLLKTSWMNTTDKKTMLWTTLRSWNEEKERYYRDNIGETFEIVIESVGKAERKEND